MPTFIKASATTTKKGGQLDIFLNTRKGLLQSDYKIQITGTAQSQSAFMIIPITLTIPNLGPPKFTSSFKDISVKINQFQVLTFPPITDPDLEDQFKVSYDFSSAASFISGNFPNFKISPKNNATDPGTYTISVTLMDDNPNP